MVSTRDTITLDRRATQTNVCLDLSNRICILNIILHCFFGFTFTFLFAVVSEQLILHFLEFVRFGVINLDGYEL